MNNLEMLLQITSTIVDKFLELNKNTIEYWINIDNQDVRWEEVVREELEDQNSIMEYIQNLATLIYNETKPKSFNNILINVLIDMKLQESLDQINKDMNQIREEYLLNQEEESLASQSQNDKNERNYSFVLPDKDGVYHAVTDSGDQIINIYSRDDLNFSKGMSVSEYMIEDKKYFMITTSIGCIYFIKEENIFWNLDEAINKISEIKNRNITFKYPDSNVIETSASFSLPNYITSNNIEQPISIKSSTPAPLIDETYLSKLYLTREKAKDLIEDNSVITSIEKIYDSMDEIFRVLSAVLPNDIKERIGFNNIPFSK